MHITKIIKIALLVFFYTITLAIGTVFLAIDLLVKCLKFIKLIFTKKQNHVKNIMVN